MANFDDIFSTPASEENQTFAPFDKETWAAKKQQ